MAEKKEKDSQSRKWLLTINNPLDHGYTHERIQEIVTGLKSVTYWCMADEIGLKDQTPHTHVFLYSPGGIRFSTIKRRFPEAHIDYSMGTAQQNMEYVSKTGKWADDPKSDTCVAGTFVEFGELPVERQGRRVDMGDLYTMVKSGMSDYEILEDMPDALVHMDRLDRVRQVIIGERYKMVYRQLQVVYLFGAPGSGKTRYVMDKYSYANVYRVTDYVHPFDNYQGQDVIVFEEFRSSFLIGQMLGYLDGYPLELPCRYNNKYACYTKVYIITNVALHEQYPFVQKEEYVSWLAFLRRITRVVRFHADGTRQDFDIRLVRDNWNLVARSPFDDFDDGR